MTTDARDALDALADGYGLSDTIEPEVAREVARWVADPGIDDPALDDLTGLAFVTIDEPESRDLDQALFLERKPDGYIAWYAIADAAHFVPPDSALFAEAMRRGASFYLPGRVVPMLPRALSEDLVSLNPHVDRRALVFEMHLDAQGQCTETRLRPARIHSRAKLDYAGVQAWLDGQSELVGADADSLESLRLLPVVGRLRMQDARERDVVHYRRAEVEVVLHPGRDAAPARFVATSRPRNDVQRYNEQLSLLCNVQGALWLAEGDTEGDGVEPIFRVHEPPGPERLAALEDQLTGIAEAQGLDPAEWIWRADGSVPLSAFLDSLPSEGRLGRVAKAAHRQAVRANQRSVFATEPGPHHGVGASVYGRFSAPMREVVGVYLHQEVVQRRNGEQGALPEGVSGAEELRAQMVIAANRARERQRGLDRDANRLVIDALFAEATATGRRWSGTVMGLTRGKVHVQLDDPAIDVKSYLRTQDRELHLDARGCQLADARGAWLSVGDPVTVWVVGREVSADRWDVRVKPQ